MNLIIFRCCWIFSRAGRLFLIDIVIKWILFCIPFPNDKKSIGGMGVIRSIIAIKQRLNTFYFNKFVIFFVDDDDGEKKQQPQNISFEYNIVFCQLSFGGIRHLSPPKCVRFRQQRHDVIIIFMSFIANWASTAKLFIIHEWKIDANWHLIVSNLFEWSRLSTSIQ